MTDDNNSSQCELIEPKTILKSALRDLVCDQYEAAILNLHDYIIAKSREIVEGQRND